MRSCEVMTNTLYLSKVGGLGRSFDFTSFSTRPLLGRVGASVLQNYNITLVEMK